MVYAHLFGVVILTDYCWSGRVILLRLLWGLIALDYLLELNSGLLSHVWDRCLTARLAVLEVSSFAHAIVVAMMLTVLLWCHANVKFFFVPKFGQLKKSCLRAKARSLAES